MKIVVPYDFSKCAENALQYAAALSKQMNASLLLLHVSYQPNPVKARIGSDKEEEVITLEDEATLKKTVATLKKQHVKVGYELLHDYQVHDTIERFAVQHKASLIVMGYKGATGLKKIFLGSITTAVINQCSIPVLVVPEWATYHGIKHIIYATDLTNVHSELKQVVSFAKLFKAVIQVIHVISYITPESVEAAAIKESFLKKIGYTPIDFELLPEDDVATAIEEYIFQKRPDLLAVFTHKVSFIKNIFNLSVSRELVFHKYIPMLVINNR